MYLLDLINVPGAAIVSGAVILLILARAGILRIFKDKHDIRLDDRYSRLIDELHDEIGRLGKVVDTERSEVARLRKVLEYERDYYEKRLSELSAEIEALRVELKGIGRRSAR